MAEETRCGAHSLEVYGEDVLVLHLRGEINEEEATAIMDVQRAFSEGKRYVLLLADATGFQTMTAGARRVFATRTMPSPPRALVCFGASFRGKVFVELIIKAAALLEGDRSRVRLRWVKDEAEARACLDELRRLLAAQTAR